MEENPDLIAPDNGLRFISDDGGLTFNRCHCMFYLPLLSLLPTDRAQFGAILRSQISTSGVLNRT